MGRKRIAHLVAAASFLAIAGTPALVQIAVERGRGERPGLFAIAGMKPTAANLRAFEGRLDDASWVAKALRPWMQYGRFVLLEDAGAKALVGRDGWLFYRPGVEYASRRWPVEEPAKPQATPVEAIVSFRDALAARGIRLLVVPVPDKESIYPEQLAARGRGRDVVVCPETGRVVSGLAKAGVEVVDLFEEYRALKRGGGDAAGPALYLVRDSHWSPAGLAVAAEAVARRVLDRGWVKPGTVEYERKSAPVRRVGDLVRMLEAPPIERRVAPEDIACVQVFKRDDGTRYRDAPESAILVLGDSFLRIYERDEPGAAGFMAHLACALGQPLASIVSDGGASTLVRQELYRRPRLLEEKKLVIWEFIERDIRLGTEGWQLVPLPPAHGTASGKGGS